MKWLLFLAIIAWLDAPAWIVALWAVCWIVDAAVWFVRGCS